MQNTSKTSKIEESCICQISQCRILLRVLLQSSESTSFLFSVGQLTLTDLRGFKLRLFVNGFENGQHFMCPLFVHPNKSNTRIHSHLNLTFHSIHVIHLRDNQSDGRVQLYKPDQQLICLVSRPLTSRMWLKSN